MAFAQMRKNFQNLTSYFCRKDSVNTMLNSKFSFIYYYPDMCTTCPELIGS